MRVRGWSINARSPAMSIEANGVPPLGNARRYGTLGLEIHGADGSRPAASVVSFSRRQGGPSKDHERRSDCTSP